MADKKKEGRLDLSQFESGNTVGKDLGEKKDAFDVEEHEKRAEELKNKDVPVYKRIFDGSLDQEKSIKHPITLYGINNERMDVLKSIMPNISKTDALNYIINAYFGANGNEIKQAVNDLRSKKKAREKDLFKSSSYD